MKRHDPRHGTTAGYQAHGRDGERACQACKAANSERSRLRRDLVERTCLDCGLHLDKPRGETGRWPQRCPMCREMRRLEIVRRSKERRPALRAAGLLPHGTAGGYNDGCRCRPCTDAMLAVRKRGLAAGRLAHGHESTYNAGCRCDACTDAKTLGSRARYNPGQRADAQRRYRARRNAALALVRKLEAEGVL